MAIKFYGYDKCNTCRKAKQVLERAGVAFQDFDITETPPTKTVLKKAMKARGMKKLFNVSGVQYKKLNIKDKINTMTEAQAINLLANNGRLIKRPLTVDGDRITVGFDENEFTSTWS